MKRRSLAIVVASIALLSACSGSPEETVETAAGEVTDEATEPAEEETPADEESPSEDAAAGGDTGSTVLLASVGSEADPEAFEIHFTTEDGEDVTSLPAGDYTIQVTDPAAMHNFHLTGGSVDESTSVPETADATWEVTLEAGEYTYKCDPHPPMTGTFTVT
jgi:plastocyanin